MNNLTGNVGDIKSDIIKWAKHCYDTGLVTSSGGNLSRRAGGHFYITANGRSLREMTEDDIIEVDPQGNVIGDSKGLRPSKEVFLHLAVYRARPDINSIIHVHPVYAVAYSAIKEGFPMITAAAELKIKKITYARYYKPGSKELMQEIEKVVINSEDFVRVVLMERHGIIVYGTDLGHCFDIAELVEETAKVNYLVDTLKAGESEAGKRMYV